jgi:hypothetical protein
MDEGGVAAFAKGTTETFPIAARPTHSNNTGSQGMPEVLDIRFFRVSHIM